MMMMMEIVITDVAVGGVLCGSSVRRKARRSVLVILSCNLVLVELVVPRGHCRRRASP